MAPLCCAANFDPFLSLDCAPTPSTLAQSKESNFAIWQHCFQLPTSSPSSSRKSSISSSTEANVAPSSSATPLATSAANPPLKLPLRVEWECGDRVGLYIDDDEQALLMTAQDGVC